MTLSAPALGLPQLSHYAASIDWLFLGLTLFSLAFLVPIFAAIAYFCVKYRRDATGVDRTHRLVGGRQRVIELVWTLVPFAMTLVFFVWAARLYVDWATPPPGALEIDVVAKQWMWKFQHPGGQREINTLHVPMGVPVKLVMASQDVIHSLFLPALRIKRDVVPGRVSTLWFQADGTGVFPLHCTEFCGTDHSVMGGTLIVLPPADYQSWLDHAQPEASLAAAGEALFRQFGCSGCHGADAAVHAPALGGLFGTTVHLADGREVVADETYLRDSILQPRRDIVAGYAPIMPSFAGQLGEDDLLKLIAYLKSLPAGARP
jgi:cytochrome c oxidase subunit II